MRSLGKKYSNSEALQKLMKYCAYQERCQQEVKNKLYEWGFYSDDSNEIIVRLIEENFLNEERFARAYCRGRFRQKQWGKIKIKQGLKLKGISPKLIEIAFSEISNEAYSDSLKNLLIKKKSSLKSLSGYQLKQKLIAYAFAKGYETDLAMELIKADFEID